MARPSTTVQAISDFIAGCKADGVWSKITEAYLMAGVTFGGITVKLKGTGTLTNNNFVSGDYQATGSGAGLTGDGSTKYIDTGLNDNTLNATSKSISLYKTTASESGDVYFMAINGSSGISGIKSASSTNITSLIAVGGKVDIIGGNISSHLILSLRENNDLELYQNGATSGFDTSVSGANQDLNWFIFARNNSGTAGVHANSTLTFAHIGTGLTDTDAANLSLRVNKLMYDLKCSTYIDSGTVAAMGLDSDVQTYANAVLTAGGNWEGV